jgi:hypothetical protein
MKWLRRLLAGKTQNAGIGRPCCGDYARCQRPCVPRGRWQGSREREKALHALHTLYIETADYIERNKLGNVHHNRSMQAARDVLSAEGWSIWHE